MLHAYSRVLPNRGGVAIDFNGALDCYLICYMLHAYSRVLPNRGGVDIDFNGALDCYLICYRLIIDYCQTGVS